MEKIINKIGKNITLIGITNVGSHLWKMNHKNSDIDLGLIYITSTSDYLRGIAFTDSKQYKEGEEDWTVHEIGKVVEMLIKGNVNYVWIVTSPIGLFDTEYSKELKEIYLNNISANIYHSIIGLAKSNYKKYLVNGNLAEGEGLSKLDKKRKIIVRTLKFGINVLNGNGLQYETITEELDNAKVVKYMEELDEAYENTELPEKPPEEPYRDFLENVRRDVDVLGLKERKTKLLSNLKVHDFSKMYPKTTTMVETIAVCCVKKAKDGDILFQDFYTKEMHLKECIKEEIKFIKDNFYLHNKHKSGLTFEERIYIFEELLFASEVI